MSNMAITWAYQQTLESGPKFVLVSLADMADENHSCYPGQTRLARMTGQGERTVRRHLEALEETGHMTREPRRNQTGQRTSDRYYLAVGQNGLPANLAAGPTGQFRQNQPANFDKTNRPNWPGNPKREPSEREPSGVTTQTSDPRDPEPTPPSNKIVDNQEQPAAPPPTGDDPPSPFCSRHPDGGDGAPCGACGEARRAAERWEDDHAAAQDKQIVAAHEFREWSKTQADCPHGIPGGNINRPAVNTPSCASCRRSHTPSLTTRPPDRTMPPCPHGMAGGDWLTTSDGTVRCSECRAEGNRRADMPIPDQADRRPSPEGHAAATEALEAARQKREAAEAEQETLRAAHAEHMATITEQLAAEPEAAPPPLANGTPAR